MKEIPYNLYIHFEELSTIWNENIGDEKNILTSGLISIELTTKLLSSIAKRNKPTDQGMIAELLDGIAEQLSLLSTFSFSTPQLPTTTKSSYSENIKQLATLDQKYVHYIEWISRHYVELSKAIGMEIGLEEQLNQLRSGFGLSAIHSEMEDKVDYAELVDPEKLAKLNKLAYYNSEDELFMTVHQISECWFNIAKTELRYLYSLFHLRSPELSETFPHFTKVIEIMEYLASHILILENMVLYDYHPLRVALRGASGGQSRQAHELFAFAIKVYREFLKVLREKGMTVLQVLEQPYLHPDLVAIIRCFEKLERALKHFFFQHYTLSANVIGSQSFGSIGHELVTLINKFVEPLFHEIDQAKYDMTLKTNFKYGDHSGVLILEKESNYPSPAHNSEVDPKVMEELVDAYFRHIGDLDPEKWINLFSDKGYIEDPVGSRPYRGHQELGIFFKGVVRTFSQLRMTIEQKNINKNTAEVFWKAEAVSYHEKELSFNGKEVFTFSPEGKIMTAQVYWDPSVVANQL